MKKVTYSWHTLAVNNQHQTTTIRQPGTSYNHPWQHQNNQQPTTWHKVWNNFHCQLHQTIKTNIHQRQPTSYSCRKHFKTLDTKEIYSMAKLYSWWRSIASDNAYRELVRGQNLFNSSKVVYYLFWSWISFVLASTPYMHSLWQWIFTANTLQGRKQNPL